MKSIAVCGSMHFFDSIKKLQQQLESSGYLVFIPSPEGTDIDYTKLDPKEQISLKKIFIDRHLEKIKKSDAILVANYQKNSLPGYIGANTFLEMGFAYALGKKIYLLHDIPDQPNTLEIQGMEPVVLQQNLELLFS